MARIPEAEIERLKEAVPVARLVEASGVELKKGGKDLLGRCPFHEDATASLVVTPGKNLWHCFGCGVGGGPIDWVMKRQGVSFRHAVELLRADAGLAELGTPTPRTRAKLPAPVALDAGEQELLDQIIGYYHETLLAAPEAMAYLERRGIASRELIEQHRLGFANRTLGLRLPATQIKAGAEVRGRLQKIGLIRESGHEHFNGSLVVPIFDAAGHVVEVYGRKLLDNLRAGTPAHLYLPGPHRGVWNERALVGQAEVILTEALIDAMTFWCAGYCNVTAAYGVEGLTDDHLATFKRLGVRRVLIAFDRDDAGERGADKAAERLMAEGIECYRVQFPKGMDANEYALKVTPAEKSLGLLIRKAVWLGKGAPPTEPPGQHVEDVPLPAAAVEIAPTVETPSLAADAVAPPAATDVDAQVSDDEVVMSFGDRRYRVRGLAKNLSAEVLKVNVLASKGEAYHVDSFDLYAARARAHYIGQAAKELACREDVIKLDLGRILLKLEALQAERIRGALTREPERPKMTAADEAEALALLKTPDLLARIVADFDACGLVGEGTNKLAGYLAATSRKLGGPLAIVVQSSSAAGKSSLMDAVLAFMPEEERIKYSAMTGQSLFYMGETNLKHKILAIAEEEGASRASYALKLLQSEGELTIASTGKDATTGNLVTQQYRVEGPVMIFLTTTAIEIDEELLNRCLVLSVDEGRAQTEAIHRLQRERRTLAGLKAKQDKTRLVRLHQNAQRLLRPLAVVNPYADRLTFLSDKTRTRRDHEKYLTLIDTIALLHQHQRPVKTMLDAGQAVEYIEVTAEDISQANAIAHEVLGRSLDELPPQTRRLLASVIDHVRSQAKAQAIPQAEVRFTRKDVRNATGWGDTQLKVHLARLVELEYLLTHRAERGQGFAYELLFDGDASTAVHLSGLIDTAGLHDYDGQRSGAKTERSAPGRGAVGQRSGVVQAAQPADKPALARVPGDETDDEPQAHLLRSNGKHPSYVVPSLAAEVRQ
ncbi:MAG: CHC2 zinc finger domain-containing protein [Betaproteobacteria bacterium]